MLLGKDKQFFPDATIGKYFFEIHGRSNGKPANHDKLERNYKELRNAHVIFIVYTDDFVTKFNIEKSILKERKGA